MATVDVIANRSSGTEALGKAYFETDTNSFIVWNGIGWVELQSDGTGAAFGSSYSVDCDGIDDYIDCGAITALNSATNFSVSMWVNFQSFVGNVAGYNIFLGSGTNTADRFLLNVVSGSSLEVYFCEATASIVGTSLGFTNNTWYHMAVYKSGSNMSFYLDNTLIDSRTNAPTSGGTTGSNFAIGRGIYGGSYSSNILVDEVAVWDSDQSSNKDSIYNSGVPADLSSLSPVHWWRMGDNDSGSGTTVTDQGSGGNDGTLMNGANIYSATTDPNPDGAGPDFSTDTP